MLDWSVSGAACFVWFVPPFSLITHFIKCVLRSRVTRSSLHMLLERAGVRKRDGVLLFMLIELMRVRSALPFALLHSICATRSTRLSSTCEQQAKAGDQGIPPRAVERALRAMPLRSCTGGRLFRRYCPLWFRYEQAGGAASGLELAGTFAMQERSPQYVVGLSPNAGVVLPLLFCSALPALRFHSLDAMPFQVLLLFSFDPLRAHLSLIILPGHVRVAVVSPT